MVIIYTWWLNKRQLSRIEVDEKGNGKSFPWNAPEHSSSVVNSQGKQERYKLLKKNDRQQKHKNHNKPGKLLHTAYCKCTWTFNRTECWSQEPMNSWDCCWEFANRYTMRTDLLNWCHLVSISKNVVFYVFLVVRIY